LTKAKSNSVKKNNFTEIVAEESDNDLSINSNKVTII